MNQSITAMFKKEFSTGKSPIKRTDQHPDLFLPNRTMNEAKPFRKMIIDQIVKSSRAENQRASVRLVSKYHTLQPNLT